MKGFGGMRPIMKVAAGGVDNGWVMAGADNEYVGLTRLIGRKVMWVLGVGREMGGEHRKRCLEMGRRNWKVGNVDGGCGEAGPRGRLRGGVGDRV